MYIESIIMYDDDKFTCNRLLFTEIDWIDLFFTIVDVTVSRSNGINNYSQSSNTTVKFNITLYCNFDSNLCFLLVDPFMMVEYGKNYQH